MENEIILISKKLDNLKLQIFNGKEFGCLFDEDDEKNFCDNAIYTYELYKLLLEANKRGCFRKMEEDQEDQEDKEENIKEILI